jgi:acetyltransferase-like isoleucine patch superfamily enzyme
VIGPAVYVHPSAIVECDTVGPGTRIWAFAHVLKGALIGRNCNICDHCFIEGNVRIGDNVTVKTGVSLWDSVTIEDDVFIGPCVAFTNDIYPRSKRYPERYVPTLVRKGASLGANCTIVAGVTIGVYAMVGAGTVVTRDVPDFALFYGNPGRVRGYACKCAKVLRFANRRRMTCECGEGYQLRKGAWVNVAEASRDRIRQSR